MKYRRVALPALGVLLFTLAGFAQTAALEGSVKAEDGTPVTGGMVVIERRDSRGHYQVRTDRKGHYFYGGLPMGVYRVSVEVDGKERDHVDDVRTGPGGPKEVSFDLHAAAADRPAPPVVLHLPEYAEMLGRVQQGDMTVDFRAFRVAGALKSGPQASKLETEERAAFRNLAASGDWAGALNSAKRALDRNYASPIGHYDAMAACQALGRTDEAAAHEKILNALLDSIRQSGDGQSPETAYFVVTVQEEYIFLNRVLHVRATSQTWVRDRKSVV